MKRFLFATLLYRLANGLLFLSVAWNLVRSSNDGAMSLAISSITSFLPAVLIAPFAKRLLERVDSRMLTIVGMVLLSLLSLLFVPFLKQSIAVLMINFALLLVFFLLEGTWDSLLAKIASQMSQAQSDRLNSRQSALTQAGLMLGGLPLGLLNRLDGPALSFYVSTLLYTVSIGLLYFHPRIFEQQLSSADLKSGFRVDASKVEAVPKEIHNIRPPWYVLVMLAMVWPCLTLVNMALPLLANSFGGGTVEHAALLDAMIGLGMAFAGLFWGALGRITAERGKWVMMTCAAFVPLPFILLQTMGYLLWPLAATFFLSGVGFGLFRVSARRQLMVTQPTYRVGQIVYSCNAYGFPMLAIGALVYALTWVHSSAVPLVVFIIFAYVGARTLLWKPEIQQRTKPYPESALISPVATAE
jgi:hypothetical protein